MTCNVVRQPLSAMCCVLGLMLWLAGMCFPAGATVLAPHFHIPEGAAALPQKTIRALHRDALGFLWLATDDGLVRYDGTRLRTFKARSDARYSLAGNALRALATMPDGGLWVGTMGEGLNRLDTATGRIDHYAQGLPDLDVLALCADGDADLWIGTGGGLARMDTASGHITSVPLRKADGSLFAGVVRALVRHGDFLWVGTEQEGLARLHMPTGTVRWIDRGGAEGLQDQQITVMHVDGAGRMWLGTGGHGLARIETDGAEPRVVHSAAGSGLGNAEITVIQDAGDGQLWVGAWDRGLGLYDPRTDTTKRLHHNDAAPGGLPSDAITAMLRLPDGKYWLGTYDRGAWLFDPFPPFQVYRREPGNADSLRDSLIWAAHPDGQGLWIGTARGLSYLSSTGGMQAPVAAGALAGDADVLLRGDIRAMQLRRGLLWLGTRRHGLLLYDVGRARVLAPATLHPALQEVATKDVRALLVDRSGIVWMGTPAGLYALQPEEGVVRKFEHTPAVLTSLPHNRIRTLFEDRDGVLWIGTSGGLVRHDGDGRFSTWTRDVDRPSGTLPGTDVRAITQDGAGNLWVGTESGLARFRPESGVDAIYTESSGLPSSTIFSALHVAGQVWVGTARGLARIDAGSGATNAYYTFDGLPDDEFNINAATALGDGRVAMGTVDGLVLFAPRDVPGGSPVGPKATPPIHVEASWGRATGEPETLHGLAGGPVQVDWRYTRSRFVVSEFSYAAHANVRVQAWLEGLDATWRDLGRDRVAEYTLLPPGEYMFRARALDRHGRWVVQSAPLTFVVAPPPWLTPLAMLAYAFLLLAALTVLAHLVRRFYARREADLQTRIAEHTHELAALNATLQERNEKLDQLMSNRVRLFRAMSHELRTPLSVVLAVLEKATTAAGGGTPAMDIALHNARRLASLVRNVLEMAHHEGILPERRRAQCGNLHEVVCNVVGSATLLADAEGRQFFWSYAGRKDAQVALDDVALHMVFDNLVSNAIKFTTDGGRVRLSVEAEPGHAVIIVEDDGPGIPEHLRRSVFDWYERGGREDTEGWGMGLPAVREAVERVGGSILVLPGIWGGARFWVFLPGATSAPQPCDAEGPLPAGAVGAQALVPAALAAGAWEGGDGQRVIPAMEDDVHGAVVASLQDVTVVLVEDDPGLLAVLQDLFPRGWRVYGESSAEAGFGLVLMHEPDVVVTDVRLPGENGIAMLRRIKADARIAHVPVLVLTAFDEAGIRDAGFTDGADGFMAKPFEPSELLRRVEALVMNRRLAYAAASRRILLDATTGMAAAGAITAGDAPCPLPGGGALSGGVDGAAAGAGSGECASQGHDGAAPGVGLPAHEAAEDGMAAAHVGRVPMEGAGAVSAAVMHAGPTAGGQVSAISGDVDAAMGGQAGAAEAQPAAISHGAQASGAVDEAFDDSPLPEWALLAQGDAMLARLHEVTEDPVVLRGLTLADVAQRLAVSTRSLQRYFERRGMGWRDYKRLRQLRHAMDLLLTTDARVADIADSVGFASASHFTMIFRRETGLSPVQWRARAGRKAGG